MNSNLNIKHPVFEAYAVNDQHIYFKCPFHRGKVVIKHGSEGNLTNRIEHRGTHCNCNETKKGYYIKITDNTHRAYIGKSQQVLKTGREWLENKYELQKKI